MNGWEASVEGKIFPFIGIVGDFDSHYGSHPTCASPTSMPGVDSELWRDGQCNNFSENNYLFGPRVSVSVGKDSPLR